MTTAEKVVAQFQVPAILLLAAAIGCVAQEFIWDGRSVPITIEVLTDVPVRASERRSDGSFGQERGTLYSNQSFQIAAGQRFRMIEMRTEGECRIE